MTYFSLKDKDDEAGLWEPVLPLNCYEADTSTTITKEEIRQDPHKLDKWRRHFVVFCVKKPHSRHAVNGYKQTKGCIANVKTEGSSKEDRGVEIIKFFESGGGWSTRTVKFSRIKWIAAAKVVLPPLKSHLCRKH